MAHAEPLVDQSQDWILLHGEESDFGTILKFTRKINTCDPDDIEISVIIAYRLNINNLNM